jgi:tetratricopeptide (TPR) repeat protein
MWRASAEAHQKQFSEAEVDVQTSLQKQPENPQAYVELAQIKAAQGQFPEALATLQKALDLDPASSPALMEMVRIYSYQKQPEKAIAAVQAQVAKSPNNPLLYVLLSSIQSSTRNFPAAAESAQKAYQLDPHNRNAVNAYATTVTELGHPEQAIPLWSTWISAHPSDDAALSMLGQLQGQVGNPAEATRDYQKALEINPNQFWALNNLAYLMVEQNQNLDVALSYAQQARTAQPHMASTADTLAWVYYHKGMYGSSRDLLEDAIKTDPNDPDIQYHLGMAYNKLGDRSDAVTHLKKAVTLAPQGGQTARQAQTALSQL